MTQDENVREMPRSIDFTIDGQPFSTDDRRQPASSLLRLAGLDPALYDLGELHGERAKTRRYSDEEVVTIRPGARFVSIRQSADVA